MDCVTAQQLVSDAMDKLPVDAEALKEAKRHCGECPSCGAFVRAMLAIQRTPLPEPPAGLADRIVAQIRDEANATAYARARALAAPHAGPVEAFEPKPSTSTVVDNTPSGLLSRLSDPRRRTSTIAWLSTAAAVFILAGWGAVLGVRAILMPGPGVVEYEFTGTAEDAGVAQSADGRSESAPGLGATQAPTESPRFISSEAGVYRISGPAADVDRKSLTVAGSTSTDLGNRPGSGSKIYRAESGETYIEGEDDNLYLIEAMTFSYGGQAYWLVSAPIEAVGAWPSLPEGVDEPRREDGYPTFEDANPERADGVFVLMGQPATEGVALPPSTPLVLPLAQCPNWTLWKVRR